MKKVFTAPKLVEERSLAVLTLGGGAVNPIVSRQDADLTVGSENGPGSGHFLSRAHLRLRWPGASHRPLRGLDGTAAARSVCIRRQPRVA